MQCKTCSTTNKAVLRMVREWQLVSVKQTFKCMNLNVTTLIYVIDKYSKAV